MRSTHQYRGTGPLGSAWSEVRNHITHVYDTDGQWPSPVTRTWASSPGRSKHACCGCLLLSANAVASPCAVHAKHVS
jgi:hypothetical protein